MKRHKKRGMFLTTAAGILSVALTIGGCSSGSAGGTGESARATHHAAAGGVGTRAPRTAAAAAWQKWGLTPLPAAPRPPVDKPVKLSSTGPVPVVTHIPTSRKVVFITVDDGLEKDPRFIAMMRDLKVPITMFLMNDVIKSDYGYFRQLQALDDHIQNHTLHHPVMSRLPLARQKQEVCGAQKVLIKEYGAAPLLFRPPYGAFDADTRTAVGECGLRAIVWWRETMGIRKLEYQVAGKRLRPGDIILAHFRGPSELKGATMTQMFSSLLKLIQQQGFAAARLEDYIQPPRR